MMYSSDGSELAVKVPAEQTSFQRPYSPPRAGNETSTVSSPSWAATEKRYMSWSSGPQRLGELEAQRAVRDLPARRRTTEDHLGGLRARADGEGVRVRRADHRDVVARQVRDRARVNPHHIRPGGERRVEVQDNAVILNGETLAGEANTGEAAHLQNRDVRTRGATLPDRRVLQRLAEADLHGRKRRHGGAVGRVARGHFHDRRGHVVGLWRHDGALEDETV